MEAHEHSQKHWLEYVDVFAKLVLSFAGVLLSYVIGTTAMRHSEAIASQQVQNQIASLQLNRRTTAANIVASQFQAVFGVDDRARAAVLSIVAEFDPDLVTRIGQDLLRRAETSVSQQRVRAILKETEQVAWRTRVDQVIDAAHRYSDVGLYAAAVREYEKAFDLLPAQRKGEIRVKAQEAHSQYEKGKYSEAAQSYDELLGSSENYHPQQ